MSDQTSLSRFSSYERTVIFLLAITQFTVVLDFMVMSPLGDMLVKSMDINASSFGNIVSAYAYSAGISGLLTAGFADRFDRKKLLVFFYIGFVVGTAFCGLADSYATIVAARIITGLFGGVIGSISMAILTDVFPMEKRGRVMGFVQMGFGASQVLGIPIGLYVANHQGWEAPFIYIAGFSVLILIGIVLLLKPVNAHLMNNTSDRNVLSHLLTTLRRSAYQRGFLTTSLLSLGGFMMMPYGTIFAVNNLDVHEDQLPILFMVSGLVSLLFMPMIGRLSDRFDKLKLFGVGSIWLIIFCLIYTNLNGVPFWLVLVLNTGIMLGVLCRMVPSMALISAVPDDSDRGAYMSIQASLQQIAGGIAATIAGLIVYQKTSTSALEHYDIVGYVVAVCVLLTLVLMYYINRYVRAKNKVTAGH
ncbi:MFS transporter [Sphingobacterium tabacisoli]|uniref:MFS transporter n=1 Tax=Sphingobacterium tabacisoli TaxID=2044855 RepID=A0ABW5L8G9_9SPHI|nr:MFS transporter [Sphingobacterium tabacisoli]